MHPYTVAWKGSYTNVCTIERLAINPVEPCHIWVENDLSSVIANHSAVKRIEKLCPLAPWLCDFDKVLRDIGDRGSSVVKVLCYKSEGRWFDSRHRLWNFSLP